MSKRPARNYDVEAEKLLRESGAYRVPVPVDVVAGHLRLHTTSVGLPDDLSGLLIVEGEKRVIGFHADHAPVRQRFTIAHEIGHYMLHVKPSQSRLFVDRFVAYRRDDEQNKGKDLEEIEANAFAAALLMPEALVRHEITKQGFDLDDEDDVGELAKRFNVSSMAMSYRLINLGLLRYRADAP